MKLLDLLEQELKEWPEGGYSVGQATDGTLHVNDKRGGFLYHTTGAYSQPSAGEYYTDEVTKDKWEWAKELLTKQHTTQSRHKNAEMIALCAEFAQKMENPMSMFQYKGVSDKEWQNIPETGSVIFYKVNEYRLKPKTHTVNGVEIPDLRIEAKEGDRFYLVDITEHDLSHCYVNFGDALDSLWVTRGLCYEPTEEGKQAAILHSKAMLGIA